MSKFFSLIKNPTKILNAILLRLPVLQKLLSEKRSIQIRFKAVLGKKLNLNNPQTFNEKMQWLKLYDRKPIYTTMVDKAAVKDFVTKKIGKQYVIPTLGIWDHFDDINFDTLPNQFVLKCTHDSGGVVICKDKKLLNVKEAKKKIEATLKNNYYYSCFEWPYKNVKPRIIAEEYMEDSHTKELRDYKFYTFSGKPHFLLLASNRQNLAKDLTFDYFDMDFNRLDLVNQDHPQSPSIPQKPTQFKKMQDLAQVLSQGIPHVRVDFYEVDGKVFFGEMTFFPNGGYLKLSPKSWEIEWGMLIQLPGFDK